MAWEVEEMWKMSEENMGKRKSVRHGRRELLVVRK